MVFYFKTYHMYKILNRAVYIIIVLMMFASCKKEGVQLNLQDGVFQPSSLIASANAITLASATENDTVLRFNWQNANFGASPVVTYTLQLTVPSDTSSANKWKNARNFIPSNKMLRYGFVSKDLNNLLNGMGLPPATPNDIVFRVKADVNQYNGSSSTISSQYTNVLVVKINSYSLNLYVPGEYQGWNPGAAPIIAPVNGKPGLYEGYVNITGTGIQYFKFTNAPDWNHTNYGDGGNGTFSIDGNAAGLSVPGPGYYELTANLNTNKWTATKTTWSIIGDATPGGWNNDTQMSYDAVAQVWKVTANMLKNGSFKFRANNAWSIDFGIDGAGKLQYADNPFFDYNPNLNNLSVPADGNYTITLDLHVSGDYTYILHKN